MTYLTKTFTKFKDENKGMNGLFEFTPELQERFLDIMKGHFNFEDFKEDAKIAPESFGNQTDKLEEGLKELIKKEFGP